MKCKVKNITSGTIALPDLQLILGETKKIKFSENVRLYVAKGYVKMLELYPDDESTKTKKDKEE